MHSSALKKQWMALVEPTKVLPLKLASLYFHQAAAKETMSKIQTKQRKEIMLPGTNRDIITA